MMEWVAFAEAVLELEKWPHSDEDFALLGQKTVVKRIQAREEIVNHLTAVRPVATLREMLRDVLSPGEPTPGVFARQEGGSAQWTSIVSSCLEKHTELSKTADGVRFLSMLVSA